MSGIETILVGLACVNALSTLASLFFPVDYKLLIIFLIFALTGAFIIRKELSLFCSTLVNQKLTLLYTLPFAVVAFVICLGVPTIYDTGLYHLQNIKWIEEYAVVPGLANLHGRFGFNANVFTLFALTSLKGFFGQEIYSINFVIFLIVAAFIIKRITDTVKSGTISAHFFFYVVVLFVLFRFDGISSPAPDYLTNCIALFLFLKVLDFSKQKENVTFKHFIPVFVLSMYIITVKLSMVPMLILCLLLLIMRFSELKKYLLLLSITGCLFFIPWLVRNVVLSGWLVYPFPTVDLFNFDWKVPKESVVAMKDIIAGWARLPGPDALAAANLPFTTWFPVWIKRIPLLHKSFFFASVLFPGLLLLSQIVPKAKRNYYVNSLLISLLSGVVFWLVMAPDFRFGQCFIMIGAFTVFLTIPLSFGFKQVKTLLSITMSFLILMYFALSKHYIHDNENRMFSIKTILIPEKIQIPAGVSFKTVMINNEKVFHPSNGDQCFDCELPCAPSTLNGLKMRGNSINDGFKIESDIH
jgi:hypothetical protein